MEDVGRVRAGRCCRRSIPPASTRAERRALADHAAKLNGALVRFQRVETFGRYYYAGLGLVVLLVGAAFLYTSVRRGRTPLAPAQPADRGADRLDRQHPADGAAPARPPAPRRAGVRGAAHRAAGDGGGARAGPRARRSRPSGSAPSGRRRGGWRTRCGTRSRRSGSRWRSSRARRRGPQREAIEVLVAESGRLEQLAREFTEFGRLPEGPAAPVDLAELLDRAGAHQRAADDAGPARARSATLPPLLGHYDPLRRAFSNILRNAVEACDGPGRASRSPPRAEDGGVRIEIRDHGPGVPPDLADRIFDPYFTGKSGGTGLGLALAKQTVEMHQGTIAVGADARRRRDLRRPDARPVSGARADPPGGRRSQHPPDAGRAAPRGGLLRRGGAQRQRRAAAARRRGSRRGPARSA